jgi:hypothetical protein
VISLYAVFGLPENAPADDVEQAYVALKAKLEEVANESTELNSALDKQTKKVLSVIENAHNTLKSPDLKRLYQSQRDSIDQKEITETHPRLGQLCVTSGIITMAQLMEAVDCQIKTGMALGEVLQDMQFITQAELDGLLLGQQMIDAPSGVTDPIASRLISLNLISEDMALIAQIEGKSTGRSVKEIMGRHEWVDSAILDAVLS